MSKNDKLFSSTTLSVSTHKGKAFDTNKKNWLRK